MCWEAAVSPAHLFRANKRKGASKGNLKKFYKNTSRHFHKLYDRIDTCKQKLAEENCEKLYQDYVSAWKAVHIMGGGKEVVMVESKLTKVKVNNEIELCEVYDSATKERIKKVFFREGISFFIKFKKKFDMAGLASVNLADDDRAERKNLWMEQKEGRYIICVNKSQEKLARSSIMRVVPDYQDRIRFMGEDPKREGNQFSFRELIAQMQ